MPKPSVHFGQCCVEILLNYADFGELLSDWRIVVRDE